MGSSIRLRVAAPLAWSALTAFCLATAVAAPAAPADNCEATKLSATGKLAACVMKSLAKATKGGLDPDQTALDACEDKFAAKLDKAETKAAGACPTEGDASAIGDAVSALAAGVADSLSGVRFLDNGDGTVTDTEQGVIWQKNTAGTGLPSSIDEVHAASDILVHLGAVNGSGADAGLGGRNDWGLPTLSQLQSILDCTTPPCVFVNPLLGPNPTPASVGSTYMLSGEIGAFPVSGLPCLKLVALEDGSIDCVDVPSAEGRSKVRTQNNAR